MNRKRFSISAGVALLVGSLVVPTGVSAAPLQPTPPSDFSLLLGVVYGVGEVGESLGLERSVNELPQGVSSSQADEAARQATRSLLKDHAREMKPILAELKSHDVVRVERAFEPLGQVLKTFSERQMRDAGVDTASLAADNSARCGFAVICVAYAAAGVHNAVVATAAAAVVVSVALWCGAWTWCGKAVATSESRTSRENFALSISRL